MSRFADVIGHDLAKNALKRSILESRVTHAYLFTGPEGVGKSTVALAFASALNCLTPTPDGDACGECLACRMTAAGTHPDVQKISPDGAQTKIKQVREMVKESNFAPLKGKWKIVIIEQGDTMNEDSSNSILKTLEEPPPYLVIMLLSKNPALVLPTIKSRCMLVRLANVPSEELTTALIERYNAEENEAKFLASYSDGRPGMAISLLGNEAFFEWRGKVIELASRIPLTDVRYALRYSEELIKLSKNENENQRSAVRQALDSMILWYRDLLSISIKGAAADLINSDLRDLLTSTPMTPERAANSINTILWARKAIEGNGNVQLVTEVMMSKLLAG